MRADTDTGDVTARALALIGDAQVMAARPVSQGLLGTLEYNAHLRHAVPLLADIAAAAVRLVAFAAERNGDWPWWGWTGEDGAGCIGCLADDDDLDDPISFTDDWSAFPHEPECWAMQLDAAIRAAGEAGQ